jgi:hypothetical protein
MLRKLFFSLIALFLISMYVPMSFGEIYYNNEYSFSVEYPDDWVVNNSGIFTEVGVWLFPEIQDGGFTGVNISYWNDMGKVLSDVEEREHQINGMSGWCSIATIEIHGHTCKNFKVIEKSVSKTVDGYNVITTKYKMNHHYPDLGDKSVVGVTSSIYIGEDIVDIRSESDDHVFKQHEQIIQNFVNTFKVSSFAPESSNPTLSFDTPYSPEPVIEQDVHCGPGTESVSGVCQVIQIEEKSSKGGGCLIATATYGSEMANEVQQLRELRDNQLLQTESGTAFMNTFNDIYYSFSPIIADYERENPMFKEAVKLAITPMISTLSLMENAESESEVLSIGISVIALNLGIYLAVPAIVVVGIKKKF